MKKGIGNFQSLSFTQAEMLKKSIIVIYFEAIDNLGFPRYFFIALRGKNISKLEKLKPEKFLPEELGVVILRGNGRPKDQDWAELKEKYGLDKADFSRKE